LERAITARLHCIDSTAVGADLAASLADIDNTSLLLQDSMPTCMHPMLQPNIHACIQMLYAAYSHACIVCCTMPIDGQQSGW